MLRGLVAVEENCFSNGMIWWAGTFSVSLTELAGKGGEPDEKNQIWKCNQTCDLQHFCIFVASSLSSCVFSLCISPFPQMLLICCHLMNVCFGFVFFYATLYLFIWRFYTKKPAVSAFSHVDTNPRIASVILASWQHQNIVGTQGCVFSLRGANEVCSTCKVEHYRTSLSDLYWSCH